MMNSLLLCALVLSVVGLGLVRGDCSQTALRCTQTLQDAIVNNPTKDQACRSLATFISCLRNGCGEVPDAALNIMKQRLANQGIYCSELNTRSTASRVLSPHMLHVLIVLAISLVFRAV